jgi:hypothetical protein
MGASAPSFDVWRLVGRLNLEPKTPPGGGDVVFDREHAAWRLRWLLTQLVDVDRGGPGAAQLDTLPRWGADGTPAALRWLEDQIDGFGLRTEADAFIRRLLDAPHQTLSRRRLSRRRSPGCCSARSSGWASTLANWLSLARRRRVGARRTRCSALRSPPGGRRSGRACDSGSEGRCPRTPSADGLGIAG